jgi:hypothetical protein
VALEVFALAPGDPPDLGALHRRIGDDLGAPAPAGPIPDLVLHFDDRASPWHTVCEIEAAERPGLLAALAEIFRAAGVTVRAASVRSADGRAYDTFELTRLDGGKLDAATEDRIRTLARDGVVARGRRFRAAGGAVPTPAETGAVGAEV